MTGKAGPKGYTAPHDVYVGQRYYKAGEPFITDAVPGAEWVEAKTSEPTSRKVPTDAKA